MPAQLELLTVFLRLLPAISLGGGSYLPHEPGVEVGDGTVTIVAVGHGGTFAVLGILPVEAVAFFQCIDLLTVLVIVGYLTCCDLRIAGASRRGEDGG